MDMCPRLITGAVIQEDMRADATYSKFEDAAERRRRRHEKEQQRRQEVWRAENAERERQAQLRRAEEEAEALDLKRKLAAAVGHTFDDDHKLDAHVHLAHNMTTKGYEKAFNAPMPEPWVRNAPFIWIRITGVEGRLFFDAKGDRIPEPS